MRFFNNSRARTLLGLGAALFFAAGVWAEEIPVRYKEGDAEGFVVVKDLKGTKVADGQITERVRNGVVTLHTVFKFKDGSLYDETAEFSQRDVFRLVKDDVVKRGPAFEMQIKSSIDAKSGRVTVKAQEGKNKKEKKYDETMKLPADVANGMIFALVKNISGKATTTVSFVGMGPKPRLVKLVLQQSGTDEVTVGGRSVEAIHYVMKVKVGGVAGVLAKVLHKLPPSTEMWVMKTEIPSFAGEKGPLSGSRTVYRIELVSPKT